MSYFVVLIVGIGLGSFGSWIAHDREGAKQLWQDFRDLLARVKK